jgi:hypothetical protein
MEAKTDNVFSGKLVLGLGLLAASLLIELILAAYSLTILGVEINSSTYASGNAGINPLQIVIGCLSPLGFALKLAAIILIVQDSSRLKGLHRRLAWIGAVCFALSIVGQLVGMLLTIGATSSGSLVSLQITLWLSLAAGLIGFAVPALLAYQVMPVWARILLAASLALYIVASTATSLMTIQATTLEQFEVVGRTMYMPSLALDRTQGLYPILAAGGTLAVVLTFLAVLIPTFSAWRARRSQLSESVS